MRIHIQPARCCLAVALLLGASIVSNAGSIVTNRGASYMNIFELGGAFVAVLLFSGAWLTSKRTQFVLLNLNQKSQIEPIRIHVR